MARARIERFDPATVRAARLAKALAHPGRIRILEILAERRSCVCGCLVGLLPLAQSTVSQHLKELREAGLISGRIDGPRTCYCLDVKTLADLRSALNDLFRRLDAARAGTSGVCCPPRTSRTVERPVSRSRPVASKTDKLLIQRKESR